jgi:nicotinamidase/pyrazinamidase
MVATAIYGPGTALVVVDVQNDFADPAGSLYVDGGKDVVPFANKQIDAANAAGAAVAYTQDWHPEHTPHFAKDGGVWPDHCIQDTWGAAFHPALTVAGEVVRKGADGGDGYSGFSVRDLTSGAVAATALESVLHAASTERIVLCGLATDYCVVETTLDARRLGFEVTVLGEGVRAVELQPGDGDRALARMREAGAELA